MVDVSNLSDSELLDLARKYNIQVPEEEAVTEEEYTDEQNNTLVDFLSKASTNVPFLKAESEFSEAFGSSLEKLGTGIIQRLSERDMLGDFYSSILPAFRPDLADQLKTTTSQDVFEATQRGARDIERRGEGRGFAYGAGEFAGEVAPFLAGAGVVPAAVAGAASGLVQPTTTGTMQEAQKRALQSGAIGGALGGAAAKGAAAIGKIPSGAAKLTRRALGVDPTAVAELTKAGITPTAGAIGGKGAKILEKTFSEMLSSADIMERSAQKTIGEIEEGILKQASQLGKAETKEEAGQAIQKGAGEFVNRFLSKSGQLYDNLGKYIKPDERVSIDTTNNVLSELSDQFADSPAIQAVFESPKMRQIKRAISEDSVNGLLNFGTVKNLRSLVGKAINDKDVIPDVAQGSLKKLYGALSDDIKLAAASKGEEAINAFNRANNFYRSGQKRIDDAIEKIVNSDTPEKAFNAAMAGTKEGATTLRKIKRSLKPDEFSELQNVTLRNMGKANPGAQDAAGNVFSPTTFLTRFNQLSPESKKVLFSGKNTELSESLDSLTKAISRVKDVEKLSNVSGTGRIVLTGGAIGMAGLRTALQALGTAYGGAKLITNPKFVDWLAKIPAQNTAPKFGKHLEKLSRIAAVSPDNREYIQDFIIGLRAE
ncbi:MAG: hypothetical protein AMJ43_07790 [Coxiella sp. DG_40]|nr:MAG: hypothetical protein AMJ43_07790 [Coxiella sp. DG_40]